MEQKELKDKLSIATYSLNSKKNELANIKVNAFSYNPRITELMFEIQTLEETIDKINKQLEEEKNETE